ncbi:helix-turn-helix transcriptional regulator [Alkalicoccus luteus]|uniref:Helix-turn-helix transcriptional regulator n=1 Tax=Alkalicoccus luteus TaxID=1237094 RepID=A0A969PRM9_9BACI|nr:helix-turn-helix transcriptional regulator [Alkalicoccus luteus]NJP37156.1 helix-turn-helix transcriptional regulator [Alkalicoccus luteus]
MDNRQWKLIRLRKERGVTQQQIAKILGIDVRIYIPREHGETPFKADEMFELSRFFDLPIEDIFSPRNSTKNGEKEKGETV